MSRYVKHIFLPITSIYKVFFSLEIEERIIQSKIYYKRKCSIIACNFIRSEDYFRGENPIKIFGCYFLK